MAFRKLLSTVFSLYSAIQLQGRQLYQVEPPWLSKTIKKVMLTRLIYLQCIIYYLISAKHCQIIFTTGFCKFKSFHSTRSTLRSNANLQNSNARINFDQVNTRAFQGFSNTKLLRIPIKLRWASTPLRSTQLHIFCWHLCNGNKSHHRIYYHHIYHNQSHFMEFCYNNSHFPVEEHLIHPREAF